MKKADRREELLESPNGLFVDVESSRVEGPLSVMVIERLSSDDIDGGGMDLVGLVSV